MANLTTGNEHNGVQIKVWIPEEFYDLLAVRAQENGTNRAAEARGLMLAGLQAESMQQQELNHLERVGWFAARDVAHVRELLLRLIFSQQQGTKEERKTQLDKIERQTGGKAIDRLTHYLREDGSDHRPAVPVFLSRACNPRGGPRSPKPACLDPSRGKSGLGES